MDFPAPPHHHPQQHAPQGPAVVAVPVSHAEAAESDADDLHLADVAGAPPPPLNAPIGAIPVDPWLVALVSVMLAIGIFGPLLVFLGRGEDVYALLCLLPTAVFAAYIRFTRRAEVYPRQLLVRYALGWFALMPLSWIAALAIIVFAMVFLALLSHILPTLPPTFYIITYFASILAAITSTETFLIWLVLTKMDSIRSLPHPRQYSFYAGAIALGMSTASCYYLVLFLKFLEEAGSASCNELEGSGSGGRTPAPNLYGGGGGGDHVTEGLRSFLAAAASTAHGGTASASSHQQNCNETMSSSGLIVLVAAIIFFIQPMMMLASYHAGLVAARAHTLNAAIHPVLELFPTVAIRTLFFMALIFAPHIIGPGTLVIMTVQCLVYYIYVKRYERKMPRAYLDRVGTLNIFGYGALPQEDDAEYPPEGPAVGHDADAPPRVVAPVSGATESDADTV